MNAPTNTNVTARLAKALSRDVNKLFSDNKERETVRQAMRLLANRADAMQVKPIDREIAGQLETIWSEAKSRKLFQYFWLPAMGWMCAVALIYLGMLREFIIFALLALSHVDIAKEIPELNIAAVYLVVTTLLQLSMLRSLEKNQILESRGMGL